MKYMEGDLLKLAQTGHFDVIIHGCNTQHCMGAGIALQIRTQYPEAYAADCKEQRYLGEISVSGCSRSRNFVIVNAYTQNQPGPDATLTAIEKCFIAIKNTYGNSNLRFGIPLIGCGLGGLSKEDVIPVIDKAMVGENITCVIYKKG